MKPAGLGEFCIYHMSDEINYACINTHHMIQGSYKDSVKTSFPPQRVANSQENLFPYFVDVCPVYRSCRGTGTKNMIKNFRIILLIVLI
jgi:hypothetical protein